MTNWADGTSGSRIASQIEVGRVVGMAPTALDGADQSAALQAIWNVNDVLHLGHGTYRLHSPLKPNVPGKQIKGMGQGLSYLQKGLDTILLDLSGTATSSDGSLHMHSNRVEDITLHGAANPAWNEPLMRCYYAHRHNISNTRFLLNYGEGIRAVEWWDSLIDNCRFDNIGDDSGLRPAVYILRNDATIGNFGYSTDNNNMLTFRSCTWETFRDGAIWIEQGVGGTGENNNIRLVDGCKFETATYRGNIVYFKALRNGLIRDAYAFVSGFDAGYSTPDDAFFFTSLMDSHIDNIHVGQNGNYIRTVFRIDGGNFRTRLWNLQMDDYADISDALVGFRYGSNTCDVRNVHFINNTGGSPVFFGSPDVPWHLEGAGTPEGVVDAQIGSTFMRTDGDVSTTLYVKTSGAGTNTGWTAK